MNLRAARQIEADIRDEFAGLRKDFGRHLDREVTIDHAREILPQHVRALVVGRCELLLDSLLNYLMEDAAEALTGASTDVKNDFYAEDLRAQLKGSFTLEPQKLHLSFDRRIVGGGVAGGLTLVAGTLIVGRLLRGDVTRIVAGLATLLASAFAFRVAHSASAASARRALESDLATYLKRSEEQVREWLAGVERFFAEEFDKFAVEHGMRGGNV